MKKFLIFASLTSVFVSAHANTLIASCSAPQGYSYYAAYGAVPKSEAGWKKDGISTGKTTLSVNNGVYDILYTDSSDRGIVSATAEGAKVVMTRNISSAIQVILLYPTSTTEIYTFWKTTDGTYQFSQVQNKIAPFQKSSVYVGNCAFVNFSSPN
jgi:hypothetical protein